MICRRLAHLLPLLALAGCQDRDLPTALAPEGAAFNQVPGGPVVNSLADPGDGTCDETECTLREAITFADPGATLTFDVTNAIALTEGQLTIDKNLTISGPGAHLLTVERSSASAAGSFRIFQITPGVTVSISGLTIAKGNPVGWGGGIYNEGTLTLTHSTVSGNSASFGGGIANLRGTLTLTHSTVSGNEASGGGGIFSQTSDNLSTSSTTILNSTVSGNTADFLGGGVRNNVGVTRILHSTLTGNRAPEGGGVWSYNDEITRTDVKGSLIWGNTADGTTPNDLFAYRTTTRYHSLGHNLVGAADPSVDFTQEFNQTGDQVNVADAKLGGLTLNTPGTTETHALLAGSPAIDTGVCTDHNNATVSTDQRGVSRPQPSGGNCDIGAFELEPVSAPIFGGFLPPARVGQLNVVKAGSAVPIKFSLGGDFGLEIFAAGYPRSEPLASCSSSGGDPVPTTTAGESSLSYDASTDQYTYVWKTDKAWAGTCRQFQMQLSSGSPYTLDFSFTR